jgi:hypothetical protein
MNRTGGEEDVEAWTRGVFQGAPCCLDVFPIAARKACDDRTAHFARHKIHRFPIASGGDREAGFDHVDPEVRERFRHPQLFRLRHAATGRLLAVAQRSVEDEDAVIERHRRSSLRRSHRRRPDTAPPADRGTAAG